MTDVYTGARVRPQERPDIPPPARAKDDPKDYVPDPDLVRAVNLAIVLGRPLLVTGEPGTGKTQLAHAVAWELGLEPVLEFTTRSTSEARDLFYTFDSVRYFHSKPASGDLPDARRFLRYEALGRAILRSHGLDAVRDRLPPGHEHDGPRRSVVLVDEIDKAPRDFPNDLLAQIEHMRFDVPEAALATIAADPALRPIVVITSNSERDLPAAFLRRCVFHWIRPPDEKMLRTILAARLGPDAKVELTDWPIDLLLRLRSDGTGMEKRPSTSELLDWIAAIRAECRTPDAAAFRAAALRNAGAVAKSAADRRAAEAAIQAWKPPVTGGAA